MAHPSTPPRHSYLTPSLSSPVTPPPPETPSTTLPTPSTVRRPGRPAYYEMSHDKMPMTVRPGNSSPISRRSTASPSLNDEEFPSEGDLEQLEAVLGQLEAGESVPSDKLAKMFRPLVDSVATIPFLRQQLAAQQETIATLQQQSMLAKRMMDIERDKFAAQRASWQSESRALLRARDAEAMAGNRQKRVLDLDVGYHQELENANKRLEMDNRLMAPRLVDTQQQIESLVNELRHLRPMVLLNTSVLDESERPGAARAAESSTAARRPPAQARATMGDARAEHLLLAAKKVRSMRNAGSAVGRLTLEELQRHGVIGPEGGVGYSEGYGEEPREIVEEEKKSSASPRHERSSTRPLGTPLLPRPKKAKRNPTTPSHARPPPQAPHTTPGGNFSDLLLAAEMATRPATPTREPGHGIAVVSASRSTAARLPSQYDNSPTKKPRREPPATVEWSTRRREGVSRYSSTDEGMEASALDLLAQASQDVAQSSHGSLASAARLGGMGDGDRHSSRSRSDTPLGPAIKLQGSSHTSHTPGRTLASAVADDPFNDPSNPNSMAFQSPTGATVPGLGKYVHLTSTMPPRRTRSPYLKWTKEEDELLTRAVMEHGEKWDLVSKCVPTRSYHQVRQRWLRKTGAFDKKPANQTPGMTPTDPSPLGRVSLVTDQGSPTPKSRKRRD